MDKDYLAKRLIYLTGRSDPTRINLIFSSVLLELDKSPPIKKKLYFFGNKYFIATIIKIHFFKFFIFIVN